jgi:hypothetical protein
LGPLTCPSACRRRRTSGRSGLAARRPTTASVPTSAGADAEISLDALIVADEPERWEAAGFTVDAAGNCPVGGVRIVIEGGNQGMSAWSLRGIAAAGGIDGLATHRATDDAPATPVAHANGVVAIDHVVVTTPDVERTVGALRASGLEPRRTRDAGAMRQTFFRLGAVILELVGPNEPSGDGPARLWGIAFTVDDLDATARGLGPERVGAVKDAVQPGRRIASLRKDAGIRVPIAFMSA